MERLIFKAVLPDGQEVYHKANSRNYSHVVAAEKGGVWFVIGFKRSYKAALRVFATLWSQIEAGLSDYAHCVILLVEPLNPLPPQTCPLCGKFTFSETCPQCHAVAFEVVDNGPPVDLTLEHSYNQRLDLKEYYTLYAKQQLKPPDLEAFLSLINAAFTHKTMYGLQFFTPAMVRYFQADNPKYSYSDILNVAAAFYDAQGPYLSKRKHIGRLIASAENRLRSNLLGHKAVDDLKAFLEAAHYVIESVESSKPSIPAPLERRPHNINTHNPYGVKHWQLMAGWYRHAQMRLERVIRIYWKSLD